MGVKTLNLKELMDSNIRNVTENDDKQNLEISGDTIQTLSSEYEILEESSTPPDKSYWFEAIDDLLINFTSVVGWSTNIGRTVFVRLGQLTLERGQDLYENIFPVLMMGPNDDPIENMMRDYRYRLFFSYFEIDSYLVLISIPSDFTEYPIRITLCFRRDITTDHIKVNPLNGKLFVCVNWEYLFVEQIDRIIDKRRDKTDESDYDVFGMYACGPFPKCFLLLDNMPKDRLCYDLKFLTNRNPCQWYGTEKSEFQTYNWRSQRIGYYCGLNSYFVVKEESKRDPINRSLLSLLRESTFVIADGIHNYYFMTSDRKYPFIDPTKYMNLGPLIAIITEGVSRLNMYQNQIIPEFCSVFYCLQNRINRPILLYWKSFKNDFNPKGPILDIFFEREHKLSQLMTKDQFYDYVIFNKNEIIRYEILCALSETHNFGINLVNEWHFYARLEVLEKNYYFYLNTQNLSSNIKNGILTSPRICYPRKGQLFSTFDVNTCPQFKDLSPKNKNIYMNEITEINNWWQANGARYNQNNRDLFDEIQCNLIHIYQLRVPTVVSISRDVKKYRISEKMIGQSIPKVSQRDRYDKQKNRGLVDRFRQVIKRSELLEYGLWDFRHKGYENVLAFVMYDFPDYLNERDKPIVITDKWDVYALIQENKRNKDNDLFHYICSVKCPFSKVSNGIQYNFDVKSIQFFEVIEKEHGINKIWYSEYQNQKDVLDNALLLTFNWKQIKEDMIMALYNLLPTSPTPLPIQNGALFDFYRKQMFESPETFKSKELIKYRLKTKG